PRLDVGLPAVVVAQVERGLRDGIDHAAQLLDREPFSEPRPDGTHALRGGPCRTRIVNLRPQRVRPVAKHRLLAVVLEGAGARLRVATHARATWYVLGRAIRLERIWIT